MIRNSIVLAAVILLALGLTACREKNTASSPMPEHELFTQDELDSFEMDLSNPVQSTLAAEGIEYLGNRSYQ